MRHQSFGSAAALLAGLAAAAFSPSPLPLGQGQGQCSRTGPTVAKLSPPQLDSLIQELRASPAAELRNLLAANLKNFDASLFLRLAELVDAETDAYEQLRLRTLASNLASTLEKVVVQAEQNLDRDADQVQTLLRELSSPSTGEFELPLSDERLAALRAAVRAQLGALDEGFVGTAKAYMKKAADDGEEGVVQVLRVLLQSFSAERFSARLGAVATAGGGVLARSAERALLLDVLATPTDSWEAVLRARLEADDAPCTADALLASLQDALAEVVLELPNGSGLQSLLAEFLNELMGKVRLLSTSEETSSEPAAE